MIEMEGFVYYSKEFVEKVRTIILSISNNQKDTHYLSEERILDIFNALKDHSPALGQYLDDLGKAKLLPTDVIELFNENKMKVVFVLAHNIVACRELFEEWKNIRQAASEEKTIRPGLWKFPESNNK